MAFADGTVEPVGQPGVQQHLNEDRHCKQRYYARLLQDFLALEGEEQHQRCE